MDKQQRVEAILEAVKEDIAQFVETESQITSSVEYEETVLAICRHLGVSLITHAQGHIPKSRNAKKKS